MSCCNVTRCACGVHFDGVLAFLQYFAKAMQTKYGEFHYSFSRSLVESTSENSIESSRPFKRHFVWTGRFFVEISSRSENSRWKASFRSIVFGSSLRTGNRLLRTTKFVYKSCNEHGISPNVFPIFSVTKTRYDIFDTKHRKQKN